MPPNRPIPPDQLPPISPAAADLESLKKLPLGIVIIFLAGLVLIVIGLSKSLAVYFFGAFPWIFTILGILLCVSAIASFFNWREIMSKANEKLLAFGFGVVFIVVLLLIAMFFPNPTDFQYMVFRIVLALAAGGVAAMIPGFLTVSVSNYVRAGGALGVFVIIYFFSPAALVTK